MQLELHMQLPDLGAFSRLQNLDLSHNQLRHMTPLAALPALHLHELYLTSNKLSTIQVRFCTVPGQTMLLHVAHPGMCKLPDKEKAKPLFSPSLECPDQATRV